jgi:hypothetical protein
MDDSNGYGRDMNEGCFLKRIEEKSRRCICIIRKEKHEKTFGRANRIKALRIKVFID